MSDELTTYPLKIRKDAMDNISKLKKLLGHVSINETVEWLFLNLNEGTKKLTALEKTLKEFEKS